MGNKIYEHIAVQIKWAIRYMYTMYLFRLRSYQINNSPISKSMNRLNYIFKK